MSRSPDEHQSDSGKQGPRVVAIGGGTGLPIVLRAAREYAGRITAVVTVADNGGSSGRLRKELGILPPGDIRNCLVALARNQFLAEELFQYRFSSGEGLAGHSLGNLFIAALTDVTGDFVSAVREAGRILEAEGEVFPSTTEDITLVARVEGDKVVEGQVEIIEWPDAIKSVYLEPENAKAVPGVLQAIREADQVILGPGSLYTSIIPNLLVEEVGETLSSCLARKIFVCNAMTQHGETDGYSAADHLRAIWQHSSHSAVDSLLINKAPIPEALLGDYAREQAFPVQFDEKELEDLNLRVVVADVVADLDHLVRHDPLKLARVLKNVL